VVIEQAFYCPLRLLLSTLFLINVQSRPEGTDPFRRAPGHSTLVSGDTFSTFVSSVRQPIECFFNWPDRLTNIQSASLVRSFSGLLLHIFGRLAASLVALIFNP